MPTKADDGWETTTSDVFYAVTNSTDENNEAEVCSHVNELHKGFVRICFIVSILVLFGLSFTVRRKRLCLNCCWGRPGVAKAVNFVDEIGRRWAYAACFVVLTYDVMNIFDGDTVWNIMPTDDEDWMRKFKWVGVFLKLFEALSICLVYYPLLACIDHRHSIAANIVGLVYLFPWIIFQSWMFYRCPFINEKGGLSEINFIWDIPIYLSYYVIGASYVLDLVRNVRRKWRNKSQRRDDLLKYRRDYKLVHHFEYVENLWRRKTIEGNDTKLNLIQRQASKIKEKFKYTKILGFRYSTRLICSLTVATCIVIWMVVTILLLMVTIMPKVDSSCADDAIDFPILTNICDHIHTIQISFVLSDVFAGLIVIGFLFNTLISYKRRWHQLLRGDHSWHILGSTPQPHSTLLKGLKFAGFQVAYAVWGWVVLTVFLFFIICFLVLALIIPIVKGERNWLVQMLINLWPTVLLGVIVIPFIQRLICRFLFIQGSVMALDNRRIYGAMSYYFLILNVIVGVFSCLKRILLPLVLGILFLSRLDQPLTMKGFEGLDPGFDSFVSMLLVDLYHNHPVVKVFVELLQEVREENQSNTGEGTEVSETKNPRSKLVRNRWRKAMVLVQNPTLALQNLEKRLREQLQRRDDQTKQPNVVDDEYPGSIEMQSLTKADNEKNSSVQVLIAQI